VIKWGSRVVVPKDEELRSLLISEFHDPKYAGHFGMSRTRVAFGRMFWWKSLAGDVVKYVSTCVVCQRNKARRHKPYGLLQTLHVPEKPWHMVTFDFIVKLPKTSRGNDSICVFVDKLTKLVHFVACKEGVSAKEFAELYVDHVVRFHGLSREFITDRDSCFTSAFWQEVTVLLGTRTVMSSSFHPQTDGQTKRVNQTLETYLRHFVSVGVNAWDTLLSRAEFAHNAAINETNRAAPFVLTYGYRPRTPVGEVVEVVHPTSAAFIERLQSSLSLARKLLIAAQQRQKARADKRRVDRVYKVGDQVLLSTKYLNLKHREPASPQMDWSI
jgi:transposase InsO family protein